MKRYEFSTNAIKLFGMANQLIIEDLTEIEERYNIELGHINPSISEKDNTYYPQFDQVIRKEASIMSLQYEIFYCLEKTIRKFVKELLIEEVGANWWDSGRIPQKVHQDVKDRIKKEVDAGITRRSDDEIDYTTFGELSTIIISNWDVFGAVLNSRKAVEKVMSTLNTVRNPIAHCSPLADDEIIRLGLSVRDWFRITG